MRLNVLIRSLSATLTVQVGLLVRLISIDEEMWSRDVYLHPWKLSLCGGEEVSWFCIFVSTAEHKQTRNSIKINGESKLNKEVFPTMCLMISLLGGYKIGEWRVGNTLGALTRMMATAWWLQFSALRTVTILAINPEFTGEFFKAHIKFSAMIPASSAFLGPRLLREGPIFRNTYLI